MSDSINYISNSSNLSSSTSLEQNNKFITVKYLNEYNKKLCESVIDIVNSATESAVSKSCAFLSEDSGVLDMHYARNTSDDQVLTATKGDNNTITVDVKGNLTVQKGLTTGTDGITSNGNISIKGGKKISGINNSSFNINAGSGEISCGTITGKTFKSNTPLFSVTDGSVNGVKIGEIVFPLSGGGSSSSNFPGDIVIEFQENSYFADRTTVMLIDHIGGFYKLEQDNGMQLLSYLDQQNYINDVGNFKEDLGNTSTPYYNAIIPIGLCYSKYDLNEQNGGVKNTWLPNFFYGINNDGNNNLVPSWDIKNINKMLLSPSNYGYPFKWTNIDEEDTDKLSVPPGSIILLNISTLSQGGGGRAPRLPYTFIRLKRMSDYNSTNEFTNARVYTNQFLDPQ